ncbi:methyl-accepting chemotaxis protein [Novosphingobium sp. SG919]|nr:MULTISPECIES: methyl-accepting chemotaxis protein [unclassified Novosphingobium]NMN06305.1 methyl-accepting chemotaxis protein [Novosphingobium sp. SG919]
MFKRRVVVPLETRFAQAVLERSPDGFLLMQNGYFTLCNAAAERVYQRTRQEIIGATPGSLAAPRQADGRPSDVHVAERLAEAQRQGFSRFEWLNLDRQGQPLRMLVTLTPVEMDGSDALMIQVQSQAETSAVVDALRDGLERLAGGDLDCRLTRAFRQDYECLRTAFNSAVDAMAGAMRSVGGIAEQVSNGSAEILAGSEDLSTRTEQQAAAVEEAAAALRQINESVQKSVQEAGHASAMVQTTLDEARQSGEVVGRAIDAMAAIEKSSQEIAEIVGVIDAIAFQTNLLALNAGVEAARAGDAGKGFAVVASEVRALAQRAGDAARDIRARIGSSTEQVSSGVGLVTATGDALERIAASVSEINDVMRRISGTSTQQAETLGQINATVRDVDSITQQNAAMAEEATATARNLADQAGVMARELGKFRFAAGQAAPAPTTAPRAPTPDPVPAPTPVAAPVAVPVRAAAPPPLPTPVPSAPPPAAAAPVAPPAAPPRPRPAPAPRSAGNTALSEDDWSEF